MKIATYAVDGRSAVGIVEGERIRELASGSSHVETVLKAARGDADTTGATHAIGDVRLLPPFGLPNEVFCIGRNYAAHAAEAGIELPKHPNVFLRQPRSLVGHGDDLVVPAVSGDFDFEGELAIVIGKAGRHIREEDALGHVLGYTCFNDGSIRNYQFEHSLAVGKNFWRSGSVGPWIVTADAFDLDDAPIIRTRVNGAEMQCAPISDLIFKVPFLISYLSTITELQPGDIIATGTPEGVGFSRKPPVWLKAGDTVEVEVSGIGTLANGVAGEAAG